MNRSLRMNSHFYTNRKFQSFQHKDLLLNLFLLHYNFDNILLEHWNSQLCYHICMSCHALFYRMNLDLIDHYSSINIRHQYNLDLLNIHNLHHMFQYILGIVLYLDYILGNLNMFHRKHQHMFHFCKLVYQD